MPKIFRLFKTDKTDSQLIGYKGASRAVRFLAIRKYYVPICPTRYTRGPNLPRYIPSVLS